MEKTHYITPWNKRKLHLQTLKGNRSSLQGFTQDKVLQRTAYKNSRQELQRIKDKHCRVSPKKALRRTAYKNSRSNEEYKRTWLSFAEKDMVVGDTEWGQHLKNGQQSAKSNPDVIWTILRLSFCETKLAETGYKSQPRKEEPTPRLLMQ